MRNLLLGLSFLLLTFSTHAQQNTNTMKTALLIVDIQNFYFPGERSEDVV